MDKQVVFKTSAFGGFEKKAVLDYIYRLNEESATTQTQLREQVESLIAARSSLDESLRQTNERLMIAQRELESTKAELSKERSRAMELSSMSEGLQGEMARSGEQLTRLRSELEQAQLQNAALQQKNTALEAKQAEVDQAITSVGKLMLDARTEADDLLANAKRDAAELLAGTQAEVDRAVRTAEDEMQARRQDAEREAAELRAEARREADATLEEAKQKADLLRIEANLSKEETVSHFRNYAHQISQIQEAVADLMADYETKTAEIARLVDTSGRAFERTVEAIAESRLESHAEEAAELPAEEPDDDFFRVAAEDTL